MIDQVIVQNLLTKLKPSVEKINAAHADYVLSGRPMSGRIDTAKGYLCVCQDALGLALKNQNAHMYFTTYLLLTEYILYSTETIEVFAKTLRPPLLQLHTSVSSKPDFIKFYLGKVPKALPVSLTSCMEEFHTTVTTGKYQPTPQAVAAAEGRRKSFLSRLRPTKRSEQELQYRVEMSNQAEGDKIITTLYNYYQPNNPGIKLTVDFGTIHKATLIALRQFTYNKKLTSDVDGLKLNKKTKGMIKALLTLLWRLMLCTNVDKSAEHNSFIDALENHTCHPLPANPSVVAEGDRALTCAGISPFNGQSVYAETRAQGQMADNNAESTANAPPTQLVINKETGAPEVVYASLMSFDATDDNAAAKEAITGAYENITYQNVDPAAASTARFESHGAPKPSPAPPQQCLVHLGAALHGKTDRVGVCVVHNKAIFKCCLTMNSSYQGNETNTEIWCSECNSQKYGADTVMGTKGASAYTQVRHDAQADQIRANYESDAQVKIRAGALSRCTIHPAHPQADKFINVCPCKTKRPYKTPAYMYYCCVDVYNQMSRTTITADTPSLSQYLCDNCATYE